MEGGEAKDPAVQGERRVVADDDAACADHKHAAAEKQQPGGDRELLFAPSPQLVAEGRGGVEDPESAQNREDQQGRLAGNGNPLKGDETTLVDPGDQLGGRDGEGGERQPMPALPEEDADAGSERYSDEGDRATLASRADEHRRGQGAEHPDAGDEHRGPAHRDRHPNDADQRPQPQGRERVRSGRRPGRRRRSSQRGRGSRWPPQCGPPRGAPFVRAARRRGREGPRTRTRPAGSEPPP